MSDDSNAVHHSDLVVEEIRENPVGRDARHLDREYVTFRNDGTDPLDLSGWTVENELGERFRFPEGTTLAPDDRLRLHSGSAPHSEFYWESDHPVWKNTGDTVFVRDAEGVLRIRESYKE